MKQHSSEWMCWVVAVFACAALATRADTIVGAGATLAVTNTEDFGFSPIQMNAGSTLAFLGAAASSAGLNEYTRTNVLYLGTPGVNTYGTWTRVSTNVFYAANAIAALNTSTEYIYTGRWHIPAAGTYSFYENLDDGACLYIDGSLLLFDVAYNTETRKQGVALAEGWHDLEVRVWNGASTGGPVLPNLKSGLLFSPANDVIGTNNQANAYPFADTGDGSVLQTAHNGVLLQKTLISGDVTFDLAGQGLAAPLVVTGGLLSQSNAASAKVTIAGGSGELSFVGMTGQTLHFPPFGVDVAFSGVADPKGITFRNQCTLIANPTSCAWRIADNATVALYGSNVLGTGDITLTNHSIYVLSSVAVTENATIHVQGTNLTAFVKPCTLDAFGNWSGSLTTLTNDISLEGAGSAAVFPDNVDFYLQGKITGTGTVSKTGSARTQIKESCDFVGDVSCAGGNTMVFESATAGHSNNTVTVGANTTLALYPPGYGASETAAWIKTLRGTGGKLYLPAKQTMTVDYFDGAQSVEGAGAMLRIHTLGTNAALSVIGTASVEIDTFAPGAALTLAGPGTPLRVTGAGATLDSLTLTAGSIPVSGEFTIAQLNGAGSLVKNGTNTLQVSFNTSSNVIQIDAGKVLFSKPSTNSVLGTLPALWLDASASNVFTQYKTYTVTNGFKVIERWNDCRTGAAGYAYNDRGDDQYQVYPYVMTAALNGLNVLSLGSYQLPISTIFGTRTEARRIYLYTNIAPQYAVMMFGSQNGGGVSVLSGTTLQRAGSTAADYRNPATPILASPAYPVWTNGVSVVATNAGLSGGYQVLSVNAKGTSLNALGWKIDNTTAGGQNYGEILLYTNALTSTQRMIAEAYLAEKWGLPYAGATIPAVTVAAGATLEINGKYSVGSVSGYGRIVSSGGSAFSLNGIFSGSVEMSGGTLTLPDVPSIPNDSTVPTGNLATWFDPSQTNRIVLGKAYTPTRPQTIAALFDRTTTNRYLLGTCNTDTTYDRRPWLSATNNPLGNLLYWMDYSNFYSGDQNGNTLRLCRNPIYIGTASNAGVISTNVQSGFIVLDSSRGGGVPMTLDVGASQVVTRDNPQSVASPIWGSATTASLKSGATYLDGVAVNGASRGFNGTTELLSFVATNTFQAAYFGFYGGDGSPAGTLNRERLGEIILFDTALDNATRANVEAYLMKKWLGKARAGFGDVSAANVSGSGTVQAAKPSQLPSFSLGFTGTLALSGNSFDYTVTTNASGTCVASPVTAIAGGLTVAATGTITVDFKVKPPVGTYTLMSYGSIANEGFATWSLVTTGNKPAGAVLLKMTGTALNLVVTSPGTMIRIL
jgi:hypothetical protein